MDNSLAKVHPELVCEWSDKNLPLTPDTVTYGSNPLQNAGSTAKGSRAKRAGGIKRQRQ